MGRVIFAIAGTAAGLVFLLSFKTHATTSAATPPAASSSPASGSSSPASGSGSTAGGGTSTSSARTVTGDPADTSYGPVEVKVTVKHGRLTAVQAIEYPDSTPLDNQIDGYAIPALNKEALAAGSAHIDTISGATYTSEGYLTSLQSALDKAGL